MIFLPIAIVLLLVLLNGIFAASEMAVVTSRKAKLQARADGGDRGAVRALALAEDPTRFLSAVQVGITLIGILAGAYGQASIAGALDAMLERVPGLQPYSEVIATTVVVVAITYLSLIIGELVPKRIALIFPETLASRVAGPLSLLARLLGPFVTLLTLSTAGALRLLGVKEQNGASVTQDEVNTMLAEGTSAGLIEPEEQLMINEVLRLGDRPIRVAMTPRPEVYWVSLADEPDQLRAELRACPYSRIVVAPALDINEPAGVVHKKDVLDNLLDTGEINLASLIQTPIFIPETTSVLKAMELLKKTRLHIAFVVDERGTFQGVVTTGDLLEMIAGDFPEEHDPLDAAIHRREDGSYLVDAGVDLVDLGQELGTELDTTAGYHTLAGLILHELARIPAVGEVVESAGFRFEVVDMDERRVDKVLVSALPLKTAKAS